MKLSVHKILAAMAIGLVLVLLMTHLHSTHQTKNVSQAPAQDAASGDTNNEVLRELAAKYQEVIAENKKYQQTIDTLAHQQKTAGQQGLSAQDQATLKQLQDQAQRTQNELQALSNQLAQTTKTSPTKPMYPVNTGTNTNPNSNVITTVVDVTASATPLNTQTTKATSKPMAADEIWNSGAGTAGATSAHQDPQQPVPYYTIPALSNLANTVLLNSLIGEVPSGNTFPQPPFPFQALVGRKELLAANGMYLPPDIAGMKISGYSVGVGSFIQGISCVRSYVTKILFVFNDGHFTVVGKDQTGTSVSPDETLGYLSDPYGNPCMQGTYITNAGRVLTLLTGVGIVSGASQGLAQAQTTTMTGFDGSTTVLNGGTGKYALGYGLSYSANKATDYILDRLKGTFDVVYIPASRQGIPTKVVVNFTQTISIDDDQKGRQLQYDTINNAGATTHQLD